MAKPFRPLKLVQNHRTLLGQLKEVQMYLIQRPIWYQTVLNSSHFYNLHVLGFIRASSSRKLSRWRTPQFSLNAFVSPAHFFQFQPSFAFAQFCFHPRTTWYHLETIIESWTSWIVKSLSLRSLIVSLQVQGHWILLNIFQDWLQHKTDHWIKSFLKDKKVPPQYTYKKRELL